MSSSHPVWFVPVINSDGKIGLTPCPGTRNESLVDSLTTLREWGASAVLTLMPTVDLNESGVADLPLEVKKAGMQWFHLPIVDDEGPREPFFSAWAKYADDIHQLLNNGQSIAIHCKGGSGRTGLMAGQIMLERGMPLDNVIDLIKAQRPNAFTISEQLEYIQAVAESQK
ncbi:cyclin-dependent kinase inhibitor 3 family protein [Endozoicomonas lisbonensis]|uniref:Protein-tyrosine phosphatase n=1 Tax=Endozoicomonas lisbonensis TaxID=3120522 RepID=A0ABV2SHD1_9GAMM